MTERIPRPGELYIHFKKKMYQIIAIAEHSETGEKLVIYQALYGDYRVYARPLSMFVSEVDHVKYPQVSQKYRFEKLERQDLTAANIPVWQQDEQPIDKKEKQQDMEQQIVEQQEADPKLIRFLDAETYQEKYEVLLDMESDITDRLINDFAVILDVVIPEGELSSRVEHLKQSIVTMAKYDNTRLR